MISVDLGTCGEGLSEPLEGDQNFALVDFGVFSEAHRDRVSAGLRTPISGKRMILPVFSENQTCCFYALIRPSGAQGNSKRFPQVSECLRRA